MRQFWFFLLALASLMIAVSCDLGTQRNAPESESMARYKEKYKKSGGLDPVSKSIGQKMK